jgi:acyl carrier protein
VLPDAEETIDAQGTAMEAERLVVVTLEELIERRGATGLTVRPQSRLTADLDCDSLELAELSAVLEDELGRDPFSEGIVPETVDELVAFYRAP